MLVEKFVSVTFIVLLTDQCIVTANCRENEVPHLVRDDRGKENVDGPSDHHQDETNLREGREGRERERGRGWGGREERERNGVENGRK